MRILSIFTSFTTGGAETLVCNLSRQFVRAGHEAAIATLSDAADVGNPREMEQQMMLAARAAGVQAVSLGLANRVNVLSGAIALRRLVARIRPDVIHAHTARAIPMLWLSRIRQPIILTHHNTRLSFPAKMFRFFDCSVSSYVAITPECSNMTRTHARRPVCLIPNAASEAFRAPLPRKRPAAIPTLLSVGALTPQKDYPTLIRAARLVADAFCSEGRTFRVWIAGAGALLPVLQELLEHEGVQGIVDLLGPRSDVQQLMRAADLYVNCSIYEGMPIALIEALSSALPIIASDVPGNRELIEPENNGVLVSASDPFALAGAIISLLHDAPRYRHLSAGALDSASRFSIEGCARAHIDLYRDVIAGACASLRAA